jgi:hypothetical protein
MRISRRRAAIFAVTAAGALAVAGIAFAAADGNSSSVNFKFSPNTGLSATKFKAGQIFVHTHTNYAHPGQKAQGGFVHRVQLYFDNDFKFTTTGVPKCTASFASNTTMKAAMAACGTAKVGVGTASTAPPSNFAACVLAFNGPVVNNHPTIKLFTRVTFGPTADCSSPATNTKGNTSVTLTGELKPANKTGFGKMLDVNNVDNAPLPLDDFTTTVKRGNYVAARCSASPWKVQAKFTYTDNQSDTVNPKQACSRG